MVIVFGPSTSRPNSLSSFDVYISIDNNLNMLSLKSWAEEMKPYFGKENQISIYEKMVKVGDEKGFLLVELTPEIKTEDNSKEIVGKPLPTINGSPSEQKAYIHFLFKRDAFIYRISYENIGGMSEIYLNMVKTFELTQLNIVPPSKSKDIIETKAWKILKAIKEKEFAQLADIVHPVKGLSFSYEGTLYAGNVKASELSTIMDNEEKRFHGTFDGSGKDWSFNFKEYYERFIYDRDFTGAEEIGYNQIIGWGCTIKDNLADYPGCIIVEYHIPSSEKGNPWSSLRLVFEELKGTWFLVGIIHDEWTI
jgi:hypothetical protein